MKLSLKLSLLLLATLGVAILQWGCGSHTRPQPQNSAHLQKTQLSVQDDFDRTVTLKAAPQRIVSLTPNITEILYALGLGDTVVAVSDFSDYPSEAKQKPRIGRHDRPSLEKIVSFKPDLVLLGYGNPKELIPSLEQAHLTFYTSDPKNIEDTFNTIERLGALCGAPERAQELLTDMRGRLDSVNRKIRHLPFRPRVFIILELDPLWTAGTETLQDEIVRIAGGENVAGNRSSFYIMSKEALFAENPDLLLVPVTSENKERVRRQLLVSKDIAALDAVKKGRIAYIDADSFSRPAPRMINSIENVAETMLNFTSNTPVPASR